MSLKTPADQDNKGGGEFKKLEGFYVTIEMHYLEAKERNKSMTEKLKLSNRQLELIRFIGGLDKSKRHEIKVICRGNEPWEIEEHVSKIKISLEPMHQEK